MAWGDKGGWQGGDPGGGPWGRPSGGGNAPPGGGGSGGGGDNNGPDLNEALKRARETLKKFSGDKETGPRRGIALGFAVIFLLWLSSGIYFVQPDEQGVVMRFGQFTHTTPAGVNYHLPWPIETVETPRVTAINRVEIGFRSNGGGFHSKNGENSLPEESLMLTGDENIVDINFEVQWKISKAADYLFNIRDPDDTMKAVSESAMREVIGKSKIATVLAEGKLAVEQDTKKLIQDTLDSYKAGIEVVSVNLLKADPPAEVIDAFRDVQTARADLETARNQAEAYSNDILPKARGQAQQYILEAEGYKQQVIARAQGEASRFSAVYEQYRQAKDVTRKRMYLETMEDILQGMDKVIVDNKGGPGVVPYLPLPEVKSKAGGAK